MPTADGWACGGGGGGGGSGGGGTSAGSVDGKVGSCADSDGLLWGRRGACRGRVDGTTAAGSALCWREVPPSISVELRIDPDYEAAETAEASRVRRGPVCRDERAPSLPSEN